jgi:hypothetical protein
MKKFLWFFLIFPTLSFASLSGESLSDRVKAYLALNGVDPDLSYRVIITPNVFENPNFQVLGPWVFKSLSKPTEETLPSLEESPQILADYAVLKEAARQASKPDAQKQYENAFFELTEQVLTLSEDDRAGQTPPVKLGFEELNTLLEALFDDNMAIATKLSIKLLSIDSALKRYNTLWWDDAITHELPEE